VAGHRSPRGSRAPHTVAAPAVRHRSAPAGHPIRTSVIATAAAVGAVATGTFSAFVPQAEAEADTVTEDTPLRTMLASASMSFGALAPEPKPNLMPVAAVTDDFSAADDHLARLGKAADLATKLAKQHAEQAEITRLIARGGVDGWIAEALQILELPQSLRPGVKRIIMKESNGNPNAINNWDANARRGTPSRGLMQTIPVTYRKYVAPEVADRPITDPVSNITAGVRYMIDKYGIETLQAGGRTSSAGHYIGY
jgi:soluble lytic murein transglycosylase-like protein